MSFPDIAESAALPYRREFHSVPVGQSNEDHIDLTDIEEHDYTDGAPAAAIQLVLKERDKQERDEQELHEHGEGTMGRGEYGDDENTTDAIFSGPAACSVPSSITSMHLAQHMRRHSISSRTSRLSISRSRPSFQRNRSSNRSRRDTGDESDWSDNGSSMPQNLRRSSSRSRMSVHSNAVSMEGDWEEPLRRRQDDHVGSISSPSLLPRIASAFGFGGGKDHADEEMGRRRAHSGSRPRSQRGSGSSARRSSEYDSERATDEISDLDQSGSERWGYTSNEDDADTYSQVSDRASGEAGYTSSLADDTSLPPQSRPSSPPIPLLPADGIFGDPASQLHEIPLQIFPESTTLSQQTILLPDEDLTIRFTSYRTDALRNALWWVGCIITAGGLGLVGRWVPKVWIKWSGKETEFEKGGKGSWVVVESPYGDLHIIPQQILDYPFPLSTVFPEALRLPSTSKPATIASQRSSRTPSIIAANARAHIPLTNGNVLPEISSGKGGAKDLMTIDLERGQTTWEETMGFLKIVEYRYTRFALQPGTGKWSMIRDWRDPRWTSVKAVGPGLAEPVREQRRILFGQNVIDIEGKSLVGLLLDEVLHPFYVFQIASIILWTVDDYYYYAFAIALISISSIVSTLIETKRTIERMREMSRFSCNVKVIVDGQWITTDSSTLVPGDIFEASDPDLVVLPCDALLLSGDAIVNESMLTGESVPVSKIPVQDEVLRALSKENKKGSTEIDSDLAKHYLFSGTKIIRIRPGGGAPGLGLKGDHAKALALVTRTGFNTTKGALVRSMLYPKPMGFSFYRDSMNFIGVLAMIAGVGFAISAIQFIRMHIHWTVILVRALDLITIVVPPALPATLTIGTTFAIGRLRKKGIFCISPNRVNIGGKVNVFCFDKTGTLTEDGLDVLGVRTIDRHEHRFSELHSDVADVPVNGGINGKTPLLYALATCHQLKLVNDEVIGDPLDIKMFEYTGWTLDEGRASKPTPTPTGKVETRAVERPQTLVQTVVRPPGTDRWRLEDALRTGGKHAHFLELGVIRTFDFVSALRRMSVVVKRLKANSMEVYVKGAPEVMADICDPSSFPKDYDDMLAYYTRNGFRVIAVAGKSVEGLTWLKAQRLKREQAESDLQFLGFIVFENKLKEGTAPVIHSLRAAHLACRMVTGDNVRTAISVARECGLVSHSSNVFIPTFVPGTGTGEDAQIEWSSVDDEKMKLDQYSLRPITPPQTLAYDAEPEDTDYQLAVTGEIFRWMLEFGAIETVQRMLVKGVIFARMSPDEKAELVERLQSLGYTVGFCGDGANDCGALKTADVGISLSEAEASVAAPFTSRTPDISCVLEVIREGRAALVTSFSCFKYMALYSLIQFTTVTLLYSFASTLGDFQFLYIDLFIIIPIAVAMGRTLPYPKIHPKRPTASLVSKKVLTSIIGQTLICGAIQGFVFVWVRRQPWYTQPPVSDGPLETFSFENSALFLVSSFQYILVAAVFSVGPPYRKPMYTNPSLVMCLTGLTAFSTFVLLSPTHSISLILDIVLFSLQFRFELLFIVIVNILLSFGFERYAERPVARIVGLMKNWIKGRKGKGRRRTTGGKVYKTIERSF